MALDISNDKAAQLIDSAIREYVMPMVRDEQQRAAEMYDEAKRAVERLNGDLAAVLARLKDSSRCWNCGAMQASRADPPPQD